MASDSWIARVDLAFVDQRLGADAVNHLLGAERTYAVEPRLEPGERLRVALEAAPSGGHPNPPWQMAIRVDLSDPRAPLEIGCSCRAGRVCEHVAQVLVDLAVSAELREAIASGGKTASHVSELPRARARALELRTLETNLALWFPKAKEPGELEMEVEVERNVSVAAADARPGLLVRHYRPPSRVALAARDVTAARLTAHHRSLVELMAPYHMDKKALVSTRGQASLLIHLLRDVIGIKVRGGKGLRFARGAFHPCVVRRGDRLVAQWTGEGLAVDVGGAVLFTGPYPYVWLEEHGMFAPVAEGVDLDAAIGLTRAPALPFTEELRDRVGRALLAHGPRLGVQVPSPELLGIVGKRTAALKLRVEGSPLDVTAELTDGTGDDVVVDDALREMLERAGLVEDPERPRTFVAKEDRAVSLWESGVDLLRASTAPTIDVVVAEALLRTRVGPPVRVDVQIGSASGWLDTKFTFTAGALAVEIRALHQALAKNRRWVVLSDGALAKISSSVSELVSDAAALFGDAASGVVPAHQLGRLARAGGHEDVTLVWHPKAEELANALVQRTAGRARLPSMLTVPLRPYQEVALGWLQLLREMGASGVLADDMGLGKTITLLAFLAREREERGPGPSLVVCPTSVVGNWFREAARFTPGLLVARWREDTDDTDLVVTSYGLLRNDIERMVKRRWRAVVLDEAQYVKNPGALTARAARRLDAESRIALSGTPVENRLSELWSLLSFANPGMLGTRADFDARYEVPIANRPDGAVAEELRRIVRPYVLRRTKSAVASELPPKTEVERTVIFGAAQRKLYDALAYALRQAVRTNLRARGSARVRLTVLTAFLRLRQMACDPRLVDPTVPRESSSKRAVFLDLVRELVSEGRRALVFSQFVELLTLWRADLDDAKVAYEYLDGATVDRDAVVDRFQNGTAPLFLVSLKAGGTGLNLTAADTVIHCDPWWNPAVEDQATDRAYRIGQDKPVTVVRLVAQGTIEEKIGLLKEKKRDLIAAVVEENEATLPALTEEDIDLFLGDVEGEVDDTDAAQG